MNSSNFGRRTGENGPERRFFAYERVERDISIIEQGLKKEVFGMLENNKARGRNNLPAIEGLPATDDEARDLVVEILQEHFKDTFLELIVQEYMAPTDRSSP